MNSSPFRIIWAFPDSSTRSPLTVMFSSPPLLEHWRAEVKEMKYFFFTDGGASSEFGTYRLCEQRRFTRAIRAGSPEPSLLAHTRSESSRTFRQKARSMASLNGWACAVKICHDGMLEDTDSLDAVKGNTFSSLHLVNWATLCENVSSGIFDQVTFKPACSATEAS